MEVKFVDLKAQYLSIKEDIDQAMAKVVESCGFIGGPIVTQFEKEFAQAHQAQFGVGTNSGTDALAIALKALGVGSGDEVITAAHTFVATAEAITMAGATPVFVDIDPDNFLIDIEKIESEVTAQTKAIIPVHLYGQPVDMPKIMELANTHGLKVVEDCAQAHLATFQSRPVGTWGDCGAFSFYPGKNLGAYGDAGAIITNDGALAKLMKRYGDHGQANKYDHQMPGINSRLDAIQAAVLRAKLFHLQKWTKRRQQVAGLYIESLKDKFICPRIEQDRGHVFHLFVIRCEKREQLREYLDKHGIQSGIHYPMCVPELKAYNRPIEKFPQAVKICSEVLSLPMHGSLCDDEVQYVIDKLRAF